MKTDDEVRAEHGWPGPLVCAVYAERGNDDECFGRLHIQTKSRQLCCRNHCADHCDMPERHLETP